MSDRVDRGLKTPGGAPLFTEAQRIFLLEHDLDAAERDEAEFREEMRSEMAAIRTLVTSRLNWIVGIAFSLLVAVVTVLVTVIANIGGP